MENVILLLMIMVSISHPLGMVVLFILVSMIYSFVMWKVLSTFWYSIILMLVMISGMMVVFTYMASMIPNESFGMNVFVLIFSVLVPFFMLIDENELSEGSFGSLKLWDNVVMLVNLWMVIFLLVIMLGVVMISDWRCGSARF